MTWIRKQHAGSDSFGNVWPHDGAVIDVPAGQAAVLLRIKDSGCTEVPESEIRAEHSAVMSGGEAVRKPARR